MRSGRSASLSVATGRGGERRLDPNEYGNHGNHSNMAEVQRKIAKAALSPREREDEQPGGAASDQDVYQVVERYKHELEQIISTLAPTLRSGGISALRSKGKGSRASPSSRPPKQSPSPGHTHATSTSVNGKGPKKAWGLSSEEEGEEQKLGSSSNVGSGSVGGGIGIGIGSTGGGDLDLGERELRRYQESLYRSGGQGDYYEDERGEEGEAEGEGDLEVEQVHVDVVDLQTEKEMEGFGAAGSAELASRSYDVGRDGSVNAVELDAIQEELQGLREWKQNAEESISQLHQTVFDLTEKMKLMIEDQKSLRAELQYMASQKHVAPQKHVATHAHAQKHFVPFFKAGGSELGQASEPVQKYVEEMANNVRKVGKERNVRKDSRKGKGVGVPKSLEGALEAVHALRPFDGGMSAPSSQLQGSASSEELDRQWSLDHYLSRGSGSGSTSPAEDEQPSHQIPHKRENSLDHYLSQRLAELDDSYNDLVIRSKAADEEKGSEGRDRAKMKASPKKTKGAKKGKGGKKKKKYTFAESLGNWKSGLRTSSSAAERPKSAAARPQAKKKTKAKARPTTASRYMKGI